jgi:hypothetical protein
LKWNGKAATFFQGGFLFRSFLSAILMHELEEIVSVRRRQIDLIIAGW